MPRINVNEKTLGAVLVLLGLVGVLVGFRYMTEPTTVPQVRKIDLQARDQQMADRALQANAGLSGEPLQNGRQPCRVLSVYDGDTIGCDLNGDGRIEKPTEEIRLLGIDTPERSYSRKNPTYGTAHPQDEPYAKESSDWMEHLVQHKTVYLEYDLRKSDRYGRTLAFVYASPSAKVSLNLQAVQQGYASKLFIGKNRRYEDLFTQAEQSAFKAKRGIWGLADL